MFNLLIGGAAGDGIETMASVFEKILKRKNFYLFSMRDFMSRVRGGHNFAQIRFGGEPVSAHRDTLDGLVAFNEESYLMHKDELSEKGFILCDTSVDVDEDRVVKLNLRGMAEESGNAKAIGTVCIGALLKLFGLGMEDVEESLRENMKPKILEANLIAVNKGYEAAPERFTIDKGAADENILLTGSNAMALGAVAGGIQFYSAYPMSPATTLLDFFQGKSELLRVAAEQAEDEIAAINMAIGASYAGARSMAGTSGGGFSLMVEALGFAGIAEIPLVVADVQRPGPATGLPTRTEQSDLLFVISASHGEFPRMVISPTHHADLFYQTARAFRIARQYQIPVILLSDQYLADSSATIPPLDVDGAYRIAALPEEESAAATEEGEDYLRYRYTENGISPLSVPGKSENLVRVDSDEHDERGVITEDAATRASMVDKRALKWQHLQYELIEPEYFGAEEPELLLVGFGSTAHALAEAVQEWNKLGGQQAGVLCFSDVWPLPTLKLGHYAAVASSIINVEQNATGQFAKLLRQEAMVDCDASILKYDGRQISVDDILWGLHQLETREEQDDE